MGYPLNGQYPLSSFLTGSLIHSPFHWRGHTGIIFHIYLCYTVHNCLQALSTFSSCDSRNLNLSPFCNTSSTSLAMWQPSVLETYGDQKNLSYLDELTGPMRQKYPNSMADRELITSLPKVTIQCLLMQ